MEHQAELLALLPVVEQRVNRRLAHWPAAHREDVAGDAVVKLVALFANAERIASIENVAAYAERVIGNVIIDAIREHAAERRMVVLSHEVAADNARPDDADPADLLADAEVAAGLTLTGKQAELLDLYRRTGSTAGVADALGISTQRACERVSRLIAAIRSGRRAGAA